MEDKKEAVIIEKDISVEVPLDSPDEPKMPSEISAQTIVAVVSDTEDKGSSDSAPVEDIPPRFTVYKPWQKRLIVLSSAFSALFASWTAQIYLPALNIAADDLHVSITRINLTVTSYMILQGVTPIFIGGFADTAGRRPAYLACFVLYIIANVGLAKSDSYGSLLGLRCFQSATISATQALCQGVVADIATSAERGQYTAFIAVPITLGPSLGPVIGGAIAQYLGWRSIFWFLAACAGVNLLFLLFFFPETCRKVVGDGSILPRRRNQTVLQLLRNRRPKKVASDSESTTPSPTENLEAPKINFAWSKFVTSLVLLCEKELCLLFMYGGFVYAGVYAVATAVPTLFSDIYGFDGFKVGLIYLPMAVGSIFSVALVGKGMNWNYRRHARKLGLEVDRDRQMDLSEFPIERARIEVAVPPLVLSMVIITAWGWALENEVSIAIICVLVFLLGLGLVSTTSVFSALIADVRPGKTGAASAANNIIKFLLGAAMAAAIDPLIQAVGPGKAYSIIAVLYVAFSPCLYFVVKRGMRWRRELREKEGSGEGTG
ncbi:MFS general substrate transporter [Annulohypoxylon truncatum]|uniref:MFS general substrate transporter n=1 Tax=Annulohypoxylon truncatum TaxID=327061 RepID=UPI0020088716|nr:MFS general substrate transporter [Annulohypoxylon truncatum]KAI1205466.1 MFS general substrate transporter [Annulohypoxylon truncatum]